MISKNIIIRILTLSPVTDFVPPGAAAYCASLYHKYDFDFRPARSRRTRLGDFTVRPGVRPIITVNADLNPYAFLVTYLHEVAHCVVYRQYKRKVLPHGHEWKSSFKTLLLPVLHPGCFPDDVLRALSAYAIHPKATTSGDPVLAEALKRYDDAPCPPNKRPLRHLKEGSSFVFNGKGFVRGTLRRTRILCTETSSQKKYTIAAHALVEEQP